MFHGIKELYSNLLPKSRRGFMAPDAGKRQIFKKNCKFYQKTAKNRDIKMLKTIPLTLETIPIIKPGEDFLTPEARKTEK